MGAPPSNEDAVNHTTAERSNPTAVTAVGAVGASATAALDGGAMTTIDTRTPNTANSAVSRKFPRRANRSEPMGDEGVPINFFAVRICKI
jgi:hypothetical protein